MKSKKKKAARIRKIVIGLDTSLSCTGWCAIQIIGNKKKLIDYGKIIPDNNAPYLDRCKEIWERLDRELDKYAGEMIGIAIEQPNSFRGGDIVRKLCGLYQIVRYMTWIRYAISPSEINTKHLKLVISDKGDASKSDVVDAVNQKFATTFIYKDTKNKKKTDDDIADAVGAAYTYIEDKNVR